MLKQTPVCAADLISPEPQPFKWRMGVKPLDNNNWLLVDQYRDADLKEIGRLIDTQRDEIIYSEPSAQAGCEELSGEVLRHLRQKPDLENVTINQHNDYTPIEAIRRIVQEDLCLLERRPEGWTMTACAVAIPTQWDVPSKYGKTLDAIHGPVPRYDTDLSQPMGTFFDRLRPEAPVWRANRTLTDDPSLRLMPQRRHQPMNEDLTVANVADRVWLRVEYQTLRRLPESGVIVFTIRILRQKISSVADYPQAFGELLRSLMRMPSDVRGYKDSTWRHARLIQEWALSTGQLTDQTLTES
ncbi:MAG: hypothetical protein CL458_04620 [Acidimicrobiaceae bacterium]|nr:hypothetical protein [Acidimicrobiaceae bacterium]|tara:strand:- start:5377 stop:6273 length:897 start_codon:yes stop_codon:yes gene_type:complete